MKVLVTGAFGCIGTAVVEELLRRGHRVRTYDLPSVRRRVIARRWHAVENVWGDVRDVVRLRGAVQNQDVVVHLAGILPPQTDFDPEMAEAVNITGTVNVLNVAKAAVPSPRVIYASSFHVFGPTIHLEPPRRVGDPVSAADAYSAHKIHCEQILQRSDLEWLILRLAYVPHIAWRKPPALMFEVPLNTRIETLHIRDAATAVANALECDAVFGRILLVGGGQSCQISYRDYMAKALAAMGIAPFPDEAFGARPYPTDWLDTEESERLLSYQRHSFEDIMADIRRQIRWRRQLVVLFRPFIARAILRLSPYWRNRQAAGESSQSRHHSTRLM